MIEQKQNEADGALADLPDENNQSESGSSSILGSVGSEGTPITRNVFAAKDL